MVKGILGGIIAVILIGVAAFLWNSSSDGGLVHALGGVTSQELAKQISTPGPQGPQGPAGPAGPCGPRGPGVVTCLASSCEVTPPKACTSPPSDDEFHRNAAIPIRITAMIPPRIPFTIG